MKDPEPVVKAAGPAEKAETLENLLESVRGLLRRFEMEAADVDVLGRFPEPLAERIPRFPIPFPWLIQASGVYEWRRSLTFPVPPIPERSPIPRPFPIRPEPLDEWEADVEEQVSTDSSAAGLIPLFILREELRLDVDGRYPQMTVSGTYYVGLTARVHWIANLSSAGPNTYTGTIWYKDGDTTSFPYTSVSVTVAKSLFPANRKVSVTFGGGGVGSRVRTYGWKSTYFHADEFEYDTVEGSAAVTAIDTGAHPNRPSSLPVESLSIETVYRRAGFNVTVSGNNPIPLNVAGPDALWSDMEMHDAMQIYWSRFANKPQWAVWTLFAGQHVAVPSLGITPTNLGGIMFDDIGSNHRQGTAVFNGSFINSPPPGDPNPTAAVQRMKFWTAVHELGHTFNLAHSWQKSHPPSWGTPWIPLANEPEARTFMNYPYNVSGGESAFFADFEYRFSDAELLFMRHAPYRFVQHGNADWFDDHGFQQAAVWPTPSLALNLRVHRSATYFEFLEPITIELKLTNVTEQPMIVDEMILSDADEMTVIIKKKGRPARQWSPYARYCARGNKKVLNPGESMYGSLFVAAGLNGWDLSEPGMYDVQIVLHNGEEDVLSNSLQLRVAPPRGYDEEFIAQDFFSEDVGRTLSFNGTRALNQANDTLREVAERCSDRKVAKHARLALGNPLTRTYKLLDVTSYDSTEVTKANGHAKPGKGFEILKREPEEAREELSKALLESPSEAADTLGHIDYKQMVSQYAGFLADAGDRDAAVDGLQKAEKTLQSRGVLASVVDDMARQRKAYGGKNPGKKSKK